MDDENTAISPLMDDDSIDATSYSEMDLDDIQSTPSMCLIINQEYQHQLEELISSIEDKLEENSQRQRYLRTQIKSGKKQSNKENSYLNFITPYFRDRKGLHPPPNEDTTQKLLNGELNQNFATAVKKWSSNDEQQLLNTIKEFYIKDQLEKLRNRKNQLLIDLQVHGGNKLERERLENEIKKCDRQISKSIDTSPIGNDLQDKIDWLYVSRLMDDVYDNLNCKLYWVNFLHPLVNKDAWLTEEIVKLGQLTKDEKQFNWERIAEQLMTNRKAWQVAQQYQITFNSNIRHHGQFTQEEIDHLTSVIERCRIEDYIPWNQVYYFIDGRSLFQLKTFWTKHTIPDDQKNRYWTLLEDTVLLTAFRKFNSNWMRIAFYLPGRSNRQVRDRYVNVLSIPKRRVGNWSPQEDRELKDLIQEFDNDFKAIARVLKCRSESQIKCRYNVLMRRKETGERAPHKVHELYELKTIRSIYLHNKLRRMTNMDSYLVTARETLLQGVDYEKAKKEDYEKLKVRNAERHMTKLEEKRMNVDCEIANIFEHYNLIPNKFQQRPNVTSSENVIFNEVLINYLDCLMNGRDSNENYLINNVIKYLFKNEITDFSSSNATGVQHPPILPPNRTTMLAFFGVLMQKDNLERSLLDDESKEEMQNIDLAQLKNDPEYKRLKQMFFSMFLWPAILTDTQLPASGNDLIDGPTINQQSNQEEDNENISLDNEVDESQQGRQSKRKRKSKQVKQPKKSKIQVREQRQAKAKWTTKVRCLQTDLIDSYLGNKK